jgi:hypothetical protein
MKQIYVLSFLFLLIFYFSFTVNLVAQPNGKLRGIITDKSTGESLSFANIYIKELGVGTATDKHGYYLISSIPANKEYTVMVSYIGYIAKSLKVIIKPNKITKLDVELSLGDNKLQTIEKIGKKIVEKNETDIGLERISIRNVQALPKGVEADVFRSLQYMPGVNFTGDVSAKYYVRGSDNNQNLILLNGAAIYNPFHALGLFSVIDPDMIKDIKFYKGGFTSEYGGRISSVMDLITVDGNRNRFSGQATASLLTAKTKIEGPIPNGSFSITARKSYNTDILKNFLNDRTIPFDFYDASAKLNYSNQNFIPGGKFVLHYFLSSDKINNKNSLKEDFEWENNVFGFSWFQVFSVPLFSELNISVSKFKGSVIPNFSNAAAEDNQLTDITFNYKFNYVYDNKDEIAAGLQVTAIKDKLLLERNTGTFSSINNRGTNFSFFAKYKFLRYEKFGLDVGTRYNFVGISQNGGNYLEPRISFTYRPFVFLSIKGAWGMYQQEVTTIADENEVISLFEPYIIVPHYLQTPKATHYSLGAKIYFTDYWEFNSEIYYKDLTNITALNENKKFSSEPDLVSATGESYGLELSSVLVYKPFRFLSSYTLSYAYKEVNNWVYYPRYDSRNFVNFTLEADLGKGWKTSLTWIYKTGLPFTKTTGFYQKLLLSDFRGDWDIYSNYIPFSILGDKNLGRLPNYHRMDINLSKELEIGFMKFSIDASIINLYNRKNIFYFDRSSGEQINMLPFLPTLSVKVKL